MSTHLPIIEFSIKFRHMVSLAVITYAATWIIPEKAFSYSQIVSSLPSDSLSLNDCRDHQ